jgi:hypothetical protein
MILEWTKSDMIGLVGVRRGAPQLFIIFLNSPFDIILNLLVLSHLTPNAFEFAKFFGRQGMYTLFSFEFQSSSSFWVAHFQDFKKFFGKAASSCLLLFKKSSVQTQEMY